MVEHNIRVIAKYYTRITLKRMAELLALSENETEDFLSSMVVKGAVEAKTDRLEGAEKSINTLSIRVGIRDRRDWSRGFENLAGLKSMTDRPLMSDRRGHFLAFLVHQHVHLYERYFNSEASKTASGASKVAMEVSGAIAAAA